jgi:hypothetical protein
MKNYYIFIAIGIIVLVFAFIFWDYIADLIIGLEGNRRFTRLVKKIAKSNDYLVLSDICVKLENNNFGVIKHLIIADKYIYAIDGRTIIGSITGKSEDEKWIHQDVRKVHIENPVKANRRLINALTRQLDEISNDVVNVVIFAKTAIVDKIIFDNPLEAVVEESDFFSYLKMMEKTAEVNDIDPEAADLLVKKINQISASNYKIRNSIY